VVTEVNGGCQEESSVLSETKEFESVLFPGRSSPLASMLNVGHAILALSAVFFAVTGYAVLFSALLPSSGITVRSSVLSEGVILTSAQALKALEDDTHYKYFTILLVPTSAYFVIANWVGWQYYQNS
jgi:Phosphatidylinositol N-acetylglucosaminyltransferase subunit Y